MSCSKDAAKAPNCVLVELLGKYQFVSRGSAIHDRIHVRVSKPEAYFIFGAELRYAACLSSVDRIKEAKSLLRKTAPVARRVLGESHQFTLYTVLLYTATSATLGDLREAVNTLEEIERIARRVLGGAHPLVGLMEGGALRNSRAALRAREASSAGRT